MLFTKVVLALLATAWALAQGSLLPFVPAFSAKLKRPNLDSVFYELGQFDSVSEWKRFEHRLFALQIELTHVEQRYEKAQRLHEKGVVSDADLERSEHDYRRVLSQLAETRHLKQTAMEMAQVAKLLLLRLDAERSDPIDRDILASLVRATENQIEAGRIQLGYLQWLAKSANTNFARTKKLIEKSALPMIRLEEAQLKRDLAAAEVIAQGDRQEILRMKLQGLQESLRTWGGEQTR
jgi:hypothetical protein